MKKWTKKKKGIAAGILALILVAAGCFLFVNVIQDKLGRVTVYMDGEGGSIGDVVTVNVKVTDIPEEFQACSFVISFDEKRLCLQEIDQGNIEVIHKAEDETDFPVWQYDVDSANREGSVSVMYLDMTAGDAPLCTKGFCKGKKDVLFRMKFKILSTCAEDDVLNLSFAQATFASVDNEKSLALQKDNLDAKDFQVSVHS